MSKLGIRISYNIKRIMKEQDIKQYQLAEKLGRTKQNMSFYFKSLENGGCSNVRNLEIIANALGVDISEFFLP